MKRDRKRKRNGAYASNVIKYYPNLAIETSTNLALSIVH